MDVFDKLSYYHADYTKSEQRLCAFIQENPQMIEEYTVSRIAERSGTSKSAVLRFCQKLGYSGYSEFRFDVIRTLHTRGERSHDNSLLQTYAGLFSAGAAELANIPEGELLELVRLIRAAPVIRCVGLLNSSLPVQKFFYDFTTLGKNVIALTDSISPGITGSLQKSDLVIFFSISGGIISSNIADFFDMASDLGCEIALVTCNPRGAALKYATRKFILPMLHLSDEATVDEHALMLIFVNILSGYYKTKL